MQDSGRLDARGFYRTEENEKTSSIAAEFVQVFAGDFSSQQPPSEWQLQAAKGVASTVKGVRRIIKETPAAKAKFDHSDGHLIVSESMLIHGRCQYSSNANHELGVLTICRPTQWYSRPGHGTSGRGGPPMDLRGLAPRTSAGTSTAPLPQSSISGTAAGLPIPREKRIKCNEPSLFMGRYFTKIESTADFQCENCEHIATSRNQLFVHLREHC